MASDDEAPPKRWRRGMGNRIKVQPADSQARAIRAERADRAFQLHKQGFTFAQIGAKLGISDEQARQDFAKAISNRPLPELDAMRAEADEILRDVVRWMRKGASKGDSNAAQAVIKALAQHAKIFGYEAPKKLEHTGPDGGPLTFAHAPTIMIPPEREPEPEPAPDGEPHDGAPAAS